MSDNKSVVLLNKIYENAKTGIDAISMLADKTHSDNFKAALSAQRQKYYEIASEASTLLSGYMALPSDSSVLSRFGMWTSVMMNTFVPQKSDRMAEVLINGSTEGIIEIMKILNSSKNADKRAVDLANRLIAAEQENIRSMQCYL